MSSWKALSWAKDQRAGSTLNKLVLILLAERADERFSCYPSVKTLAEEAEATPRGVRAALRRLEADGYLTTVARQRSNGARTSSRYYLSHPDAPHVSAVDDARETPRNSVPGGEELSSGGGGTQFRGGRNSVPGGEELSSGYGGELSSPLRTTQMNTHSTTQTAHGAEAAADSRMHDDDEHQALAVALLSELPAPWRVGPRTVRSLAPLVSAAFGAGWPPATLAAHLAANPDGVNAPAAVLRARLDDLPPAPQVITPARPGPANVRSFCRRHAMPSPCAVCADEGSPSPDARLSVS
jgi:Helix-turn-helix domain